MAQAATRTEDWQTARLHLLTALEDAPESLTVLMNLAMVQWRAGDLNDAIASFNQIVNRDTVPPIVWQLYAQLQLEAGNPQGTREILRNIETSTPASLTLGAIADIEMRAFERAKLALEEAVEHDPAYAPAWYQLAIIHRDHIPNTVEAQIAFRTFKEHDPANRRADIPDATFLGQTLPATDREDAAAGLAETATRTPGITTPPPTNLSQTARMPTTVPGEQQIRARIAGARQSIERGDTDAALIALQEIVQQHPDNPDAVWALAQFYDIQLELKDRANVLYNTFQQLFPNDHRISQIPRDTRSRQSAQHAASTDAARQSLLFQQGVDHYNKTEWDAAITAFRRVLAIAPQDPGAAFNLGLTYHKTGNLDAAAAAFRQALEHESDMIKSVYMLGLTERDRNNIPEALHLLNRVIRMQPDFIKAHHALGRIYFNEGRPDMTAIHYQRILEIDAQAPEAQHARAWMQNQQNPR